MANLLQPRFLDLIQDALRAHRGDPEARTQLIRRGAPVVADLVRPGAGMFVSRAVELLDEFRAHQAGMLAGGEPSEDDGADASRPQDRFVRHLLARSHGFYVIAGEPGQGKTVLALRLAERWMKERGYQVIALGGLHADDVRKWRTEDWPIEHEHPLKFAQAMRDLSESMVEHSERYPVGISRRVLLIDDAALIAHVSAAGMTRALLQAQSVSRHLHWHLILTARAFKQIATLAENADVRFLKRPVWSSLTTERTETRVWWEAADRGYAELKATDDWKEAPHEREWVHVQSRSWEGCMHVSPPGAAEIVDADD